MVYIGPGGNVGSPVTPGIGRPHYLRFEVESDNPAVGDLLPHHLVDLAHARPVPRASC